MSFWLDRFRKEDEEDIWEELKQMLLNSPSEQEIALKKQEEQAKIDAVVERMFPDIKKTQGEPYLRYEDLLNPQGLQKRMQEQYMQEDYQRLMKNQQGEITPQNILQKMDMFSPKKMNGINSLAENYEPEEWFPDSKKLEAVVSKYESLPETYNEIRSDDTLTKEQKADLIKKVSENNLHQIELEDKEAKKKILKDFGKDVAKDTAVNIATAYIPYSGAAVKIANKIAPKMVTKVSPYIEAITNKVTEKLLPYTGKKIAENAIAGASDGLLSGVVEQVPELLRDPEDITPQSVAKKVLANTATGVSSSAFKGVTNRLLAKQKINKVGTPDELPLRQQRKMKEYSVNYHNDYQAGTNIKLPDGTKSRVGMLDYGDIKLNEAKTVTDLKTQVTRGNLQKGDSLYDKTLGKQQKTPKLNSHEQWLEELKRRRKNVVWW